MSLWRMVVDFEELGEIAQEVSQISGHVNHMAQEHGMHMIGGIKNTWGGGNADAFEVKVRKYIERLGEVATDLQDVAKQLEEKAEQIYATEKGNMTTAFTRTY